MKLPLAIVILGLIAPSNAFAAEPDRAGLLAEAIKAAVEIQNQQDRADALIEIAATQLRIGDIDSARRTAKDIAQLRNKELTYGQIAMRCADIEGAKSMLDMVSSDVVKSA